MNPGPGTRAQWDAAARRAATGVNLAWWVDHTLPLWFGLCAAGTCLVLLARTLRWPMAPVWLALGLLAAALAAWAAWRARRRFESPDSTRVRIEETHGLHNRLSSAAAGVGAWPPVPERIRTGLTFQWHRPVLAAAVASALLITAAVVRIPDPVRPAPITIETPAAVSEVQDWLKQLREEKLADPERLAEIEHEADKMLQQPPDQWYQHNTLEAADHLREQTAQSLRELNQHLANSQQALVNFRAFEGRIPAAMLPAFNQQLTGALEGLKLGGIPADPSLLSQLSQLDPSSLGSLTPEQAAALAKQLGSKSASLQKILGKAGQCQSGGTCAATNGAATFAAQPGAGGVNRGPGTAPLTFTESPSQVGSTAKERVSNPNLENAPPTELLALTKGEHKVDESEYRGPASGGAASAGTGGEAVWEQNVTPEEREVLKHYFR
jgi:hypothetical protein